jgi:hypothetical protein
MSSERIDGASTTTGASGSLSSGAVDEANRNADEFNKMMGGPENGQGDLAYYLELQRAMMKEQQAYTALSNVLKARSDACLSAVRNFKQ